MKEDVVERLKKAFGEEDATKRYTKFYELGGWQQSKRKTEFVEFSRKLAAERGIVGYQREREEGIGGVPLGQRLLENFNITGTDVICEYDDFQQINNAAMQQMADDIRRTAVLGLDMPHMIIQNRFGVSVTPETINRYLEVANHAMCGGAVAQEHMAEVHPGLVRDTSVKILTGDDELAAHIDPQFLIDLNREYPEEKAEKVKEGIGKHVYQVTRIPTIAVRIGDGGITRRWNANQSALAFIVAYKLGGGSVLADFSLTAKHMQYVLLATPTWPRRGPKDNEPGGLPYGYIGDICQADALTDDPVRYCAEASALAGFYYISIWVNNYVIGGVGASAVAYFCSDGVLDDFYQHVADYVKEKYGGFAQAKPSFDVVRDVTEEAVFYILEQYNKYPLLLESHWGGAIRFGMLQSTAAVGVGLATGHSLAAHLALHYTQAFVGKEAWGRAGFGSGDSVDHISIAYAASVRPDEGLVPELRGANMPQDSTSALIMAIEPASVFSPHAARGDAWVLSPVIKGAFADSNLPFDFKRIRAEIAKGALREFMPEGERDLIKPAR
ncbi:MAG: methyl-coenzyme M reductase subunit alpha [Candidatus Alkanophagales archaeon]|nr:MAG: methyl-coenzyme M reductase subunit alpha [Candidatus Alkanophagales archaeon]